MDRDDEECRVLLAPLRGAEPDIRSGVDVAKARRTGRRIAKRRVLAGIGAATSLVVLVGLGTNAVVNGTPDSMTPASGRFDVFTQVVTVGSAGGFTPESFTTGTDRNVIRLRRTDGGHGTATITVFSPSSSPAYPLGDEMRAGDVHGRTALWEELPRPTLAWKWSDDAWAKVEWEAPDADIRARIHHVAESVQPVERLRVRVPFTLQRDATLTLGSVSVNAHGAESWAIFSHRGPDGPSTISVGLRPNEPHVVTNSFVDGRQLLVEPNRVNLPDVAPGYMAVATTDARQGDAALLTGLAVTLRPAKDLGDRTTWATTVWR